MTMRNEVTDLLLEELEKHGLKGAINDRSKHLEVSWTLPNGETRFIIAPKTPSDWRSGMNCRSDLRKMLRADNVALKQESVTSFTRAISLPKESIVSQAAHEKALRQDVATLSDLVLELYDQNQLMVAQISSILDKMSSISVVSTVMSNVSFTGQAQVSEQFASEQPEYKPLTKGSTTSNEIVLNCVKYEWTAKTDIQKNSGLNQGVVSQCLIRLRKRGLVENGLRGQWRKKPNDNIIVLGSGIASAS